MKSVYLKCYAYQNIYDSKSNDYWVFYRITDELLYGVLVSPKQLVIQNNIYFDTIFLKMTYNKKYSKC